ncbi:type II toxin-antitoxin system ParD family antitoxin [Nocardioides carbamazepini]|uniref:type II toxin-antitoxin system ParD family antitoxin n=1 Tax=Nocardioides carbamazepini TaxID=2854259 RepID=UPI00214A2DDD|nr:type II toxin-antitoxin system ParD family antitoxin [Nocardioides carbamazepini]MCR1784439.1 type II toxin-antitoxin system ParD family antitoxin [Nocardioides carbamazepini]
MATRNVVLTRQQEELIAALVAEGRFQNASEVLREGLRLVEKDQLELRARLAAFQREAQRGWDDEAAGRSTDLTADELPDHIAMLSARAAREAADAG